MRVISIINQKGGCGKTTISLNLASAMANAGQRTLLVDMDPQGHCAVGLAVPEEQIEQSIYDILISNARGEGIKLNEVLWQISENFELAPASIDLAAFEQQMAAVGDREDCLKNILEQVNDLYDYVIVDCPPSISLLTFNALRAATDVVVPVDTGYFSLHGLGKQLETLDLLSRQCNQQINVMVLGSMYDIRTKMGREILGELRKHFGDKMLKTVVNFNTKLKEAASLGQPVCEYDPACKGSKDFVALADELIASDTYLHRSEMVDSISKELEAISASAKEILEEMDAGSSGQVEIAEEISSEELEAAVDVQIADFYGHRQIEGTIMFSTLYPRAEKVAIAGDFNGWKPEKSPMVKMGDNGQWQIQMPITKGSYRYRMVVDGQWQQDPYNEKCEMNPYGELNSLLEVH